MPSMSELRSRLDNIRREIDKLKAQEALLLDMLGESPKPSRRAAKGSVKAMVLDLLEESQRSGINAVRAVEMAEQRGVTLERGTVSSLLSRLKSDDIVVHVGDTYKLKKYAGMPSAVTTIRTSGEGSF